MMEYLMYCKDVKRKPCDVEGKPCSGYCFLENGKYYPDIEKDENGKRSTCAFSESTTRVYEKKNKMLDELLGGLENE
ncbi:hypothetical protein HNV12_03780 [Methanococcoides sp. SA1]|nr:hypothetical protein [Methanococcoides sp. SA1]